MAFKVEIFLEFPAQSPVREDCDARVVTDAGATKGQGTLGKRDPCVPISVNILPARAVGVWLNMKGNIPNIPEAKPSG